MKDVCYRQRMTIPLAIIVILTLLSTSCSLLPQELQIELERAFREQTEQLIEELKRWAAAEFEEFTDEWQRKLAEAWEDASDKAKEFFGLAAPEDVGVVVFGLDPQTEKPVIAEAFKTAYMEAGGGRVIGDPTDLVNFWDRATSRVLVQYFTGGSEERSAIVLMDGETQAYVLPGLWLTTYENLGGPQLAGYPTSNPKTWNMNPVIEFWERWGRGKRQTFLVSGEVYALMRPSGLNAIYVVPPKVWPTYLDAANEIGYPLSSYPIDDKRWRQDTEISTETRAILNQWSAQPFRIQVYENGSLMWLAGRSDLETVEYGRVVVFWNLGTATLLLGVRRELGFVYEDRFVAGASDTCFARTVRHAANTAADASGDVLIPQIALLPLRATLEGVGLRVESALGKLALLAAKVLTERAGGGELTDAIASTLAGEVIDSIYAKSVGDILAMPMANASVMILEEELSRMSRGRLSYESSIRAGEGNIRFTADMNTSLRIEYDPLTRTMTGVIVSDCAPKGIMFFYRVDPSTGYMAEATEVWDGRVHFIDLSTGGSLP